MSETLIKELKEFVEDFESKWAYSDISDADPNDVALYAAAKNILQFH